MPLQRCFSLATGLCLLGCSAGAKSSPPESAEATAPTFAAVAAASAVPVAPTASAAPATTAVPAASEAQQPVNPSTGNPAGIAGEPPGDAPTEPGFGPKSAVAEAFGMVNLTQPPSTERDEQRALTVRMGEVRIEGELNSDVTKRILRQGYGAYRGCYQSLLRRVPNARGTVEVSLVLNASGSVSRATIGESDIKDSAMKSCLLKAVKSLVFPQPPRTSAQLTLPLVFSH